MAINRIAFNADRRSARATQSRIAGFVPLPPQATLGAYAWVWPADLYRWAYQNAVQEVVRSRRRRFAQMQCEAAN